jgi:membrane protein insertase Oxa1/YidC/SpoIIIJ
VQYCNQQQQQQQQQQHFRHFMPLCILLRTIRWPFLLAVENINYLTHPQKQL